LAVSDAPDRLPGRNASCGPQAAAKVHYGRSILNADDETVRFQNETHETGVIVLRGGATVRVAGSTFELALYDALYVPPHTEIDVIPPAAGCDLAEVSAPVDHDYPLFCGAATRGRGLLFAARGETFARSEYSLRENRAGRANCGGVTFSTPGNCKSWPPHEHGEMLEEVYLYIAMPAPAWGTQFVYTDVKAPELAVVVREDDCV
jgi:5-deoxy-glucuronate isomerase